MPFSKGPDLSRFQHVIGGTPIGGPQDGAENQGKLVLGILPRGTRFLVVRTERSNGQKTLHLARTRGDYLFSIRDGRVEDLGLIRRRPKKRKT